jgi:hypothetical protein
VLQLTPVSCPETLGISFRNANELSNNKTRRGFKENHGVLLTFALCSHTLYAECVGKWLPSSICICGRYRRH